MAGDPEFENLVDRHYGGLYQFALSLTRTESDARDLVQETFLAWAAKGGQLQDRTKAKSWLFTTLHRHYLQRQRRRTRFPEFEVGEMEAELPVVEPAVVEGLDGATAVALLARVPEPFRAAVALFYLEDCSLAEIAEIVDAPLGTVKSRISRGIGQLKQMLAAETRGHLPTPERQP
jgi:RNA polymerase sigma factor (sigma-70 family)